MTIFWTPERDIPNEDESGAFIYNTTGLLVPRTELERIGFKSEIVLEQAA